MKKTETFTSLTFKLKHFHSYYSFVACRNVKLLEVWVKIKLHPNDRKEVRVVSSFDDVYERKTVTITSATHTNCKFANATMF